MAINPRIGALTVINEALMVLDYEPSERLLTDGDLEEARELLCGARAKLTDKPWPDIPRRESDLARFEEWHSTKAAEQRRDGRQ